MVQGWAWVGVEVGQGWDWGAVRLIWFHECLRWKRVFRVALGFLSRELRAGASL